MQQQIYYIKAAIKRIQRKLLSMLSKSRLAEYIGKYDAEATFTNFKNIPSYATAHLLLQVCSALRRHADS